MPKKKRGSGFYHVKTGKYHNQFGGDGRGFSGRQKFTNEVEGSNLNQPNNDEISALNLRADTPVDSNQPCVSQPTVLSDQSRGPEFQETLDWQILSHKLSLLNAVLPMQWKGILSKEGFHVVRVSSSQNVAIQRSVFVPFLGALKVFVHRKDITEDLRSGLLKDLQLDVLQVDSSNVFVDTVLKVVNAVRSWEICAGVDQEKFQEMWITDTSGYVDDNIFDETRYVKTFRSNKCSLLISLDKWRCVECKRVGSRFRERLKSHQNEAVHPNTKNIYLDDKQKLFKLKSQQEELGKAKRKIDYLQNKVQHLLQAQSVPIDKELADDLTDILRDTNLTPLQQLFIQQQCKSGTRKKATAMRWHPTMIRFALLIKSTSSAAYSAIQNSGIIRLPSERTLFEYSHAIERSEGVFTEKLDIYGEKVKSFKEAHQHYHNLLMDEIHICQKLVYRKSDGLLVGYENLNEVEKEMKNLVDVTNEDKPSEPCIATKVLAYMIRGCTSSTREVIAAFPVACLSKQQLFDRTWEVISACEFAGIKILAVVCDGSSVNRAFIAMHTPATKSDLGVVFDTVNMCSPERNIYFISDPPHLLKTIRNCFSKSGRGPKSARLLFNGKDYIKWETIIKLYNEDKDCNFRRCWKLTSQNVYLNSYTCMKVLYAAQVMSKTVALDLKDRGWPGTESTVEFIEKTNDFFDNLNGAHTSVSVKRANKRLAAYCAEDDDRFQELKDYEKYFLNWSEKVKNLPDFSDDAKAKMTLSWQTIEGILITINGFIGAMKYLLSPNVKAKYVNAQVFCQDPLEQYFGKQRSSIGSRSNPTVESFLSSDVKISVHRDLNVKRRSGNTLCINTAMEISDEPLRKRRKSF